jgi:hypothetical protein
MSPFDAMRKWQCVRLSPTGPPRQRGDPGFCRSLIAIMAANEFGPDTFMRPRLQQLRYSFSGFVDAVKSDQECKRAVECSRQQRAPCVRINRKTRPPTRASLMKSDHSWQSRSGRAVSSFGKASESQALLVSLYVLGPLVRAEHLAEIGHATSRVCLKK